MNAQLNFTSLTNSRGRSKNANRPVMITVAIRMFTRTGLSIEILMMARIDQPSVG